MNRLWHLALWIWIALPVVFVCFPESVTDLFVFLHLVKSGSWAQFAVMVTGGAIWLGFNILGTFVLLITRILHGGDRQTSWEERP